MATSGANQLVAWMEADNSIWAARVGPDGQPLDGRGTKLSSRYAWTAPRVEFDGRFYVVAWAQGAELVVSWIDPATGAVVARRTRAEINNGQVALATTPEAAYIAWSDEKAEIRVLRIPNDTRSMAGPSVVVSPDTGRNHADPALSWNGSTLLAVWTEIKTINSDPPFTTRERLWAARVTPELTLLDTPPLFIGDLPNVNEGAPSVASNGIDWLVVWDGERAGIRARRVLHDGRLEEYQPTILTAGFLPAVAWDGVRYALVWEDAWHNSVNYGQRALRIGSIPAEGPLGVTFGAGIASLDAYPNAPPAITRAGDGRVVVAYTRVSFVPEHGGVERAFLRFIDTSTSGPRKRRSAR